MLSVLGLSFSQVSKFTNFTVRLKVHKRTSIILSVTRPDEILRLQSCECVWYRACTSSNTQHKNTTQPIVEESLFPYNQVQTSCSAHQIFLRPNVSCVPQTQTKDHILVESPYFVRDFLMKQFGKMRSSSAGIEAFKVAFNKTVKLLPICATMTQRHGGCHCSNVLIFKEMFGIFSVNVCETEKCTF